MLNPSEIIEGGNTYSLGKVQGKKIMYDFDKMLVYLDVKGKLLFGDKFKIIKEDHALLFKLCNYIIGDLENCGSAHIDPKKGILLTGPVGCGKTSIMKLLRHLTPHIKKYELFPCRNVVFSFNGLGYRVIEDYGNSGYYFFDDLGVEPVGKHYGKDCDVMGEILISRHDLFIRTGIRTHITTNLTSDEIEERYGHRVRSRMRELFNLVAFDPQSEDKRF